MLKAVVAQFNASQLITQREMVSRLVRENLMKRARRFNLILDDVSITHVAFSPEFTHAVEGKPRAYRVVCASASSLYQSLIVQSLLPRKHSQASRPANRSACRLFSRPSHSRKGEFSNFPSPDLPALLLFTQHSYSFLRFHRSNPSSFEPREKHDQPS